MNPKSNPSFLSIMTTIERKLKERLKLARLIDSCSNEMLPCSRCDKEKLKCVVDNKKSVRCAECVRSKSSCNVQLDAPINNWESIARQRLKLEQEEEEAMAKILRLRKQQRFLKDRESEMARRGLRFLDELDATKTKEREEKEAREC
jgi:hypothetical protein